jgi:hypothetical protein
MSNKIEQQYWGDEPPWDHLPKDPTDLRVATQYCRAIQWYHNMADENDYKKWVVEWMSKNKYSAANIAFVKKLSDVSIYPDEVDGLRLGMSIGPIARMLTLGAPLIDKQISDLKKCITYLISKGKQVRQEAVASGRPSVRDHVREQVRELIEELELLVDKILTGEKIDWKPEDFIDVHKVKPMQSAIIADWFERQMGDINLIISGKADEQLKEGYSFFKKPILRRYQEWLTSVVAAFREVKKAAPTIRRVKRRKSPIDRVKKMKWRKEDTELGIVSIHPSRIIGASKVILFNTKSRDVTILEAETVDGLDVDGTTIKGVDPKTCKTKKVRKPKEFLSSVKGDVGIRAFKNAFDALKTDEKEATGRTNDETIILIVYK